MFSKVSSPRGEIAVRVIRALDELGIASVAVYSEADRDAQHVRRATEAYLLGPGPAAESYLRVEKLLDATALRRRGRAPRLRLPGRERGVRQSLEDAGVAFIGPPASAIEAMGSKTRARELMQKARRPDRAGHDGAGDRLWTTPGPSPRRWASRSP